MIWLVAEGVEDEEEGEDDGDEGEIDGVAQAAFEAQVEQGKVADFAADGKQICTRSVYCDMQRFGQIIRGSDRQKRGIQRKRQR